MRNSRGNPPLLVSFVLFLALAGEGFGGPEPYSILYATIEAGGHQRSALYSVDSTLGDWGTIGGYDKGVVTLRQGFAGQVFEPPTTLPTVFTHPAGQPLLIPFSALAADSSDIEGFPLTFSLIESHSKDGASLTLAGEAIEYNGPASIQGSDSFDYGLSDAFGGGVVGTVIVMNEGSTNGAPATISGIAFNPSGQIVLNLSGTPGLTYRVQVSQDLVGWTPLASVAAPASGAFTATDPGAPGYLERFYRALWP